MACLTGCLLVPPAERKPGLSMVKGRGVELHRSRVEAEMLFVAGDTGLIGGPAMESAPAGESILNRLVTGKTFRSADFLANFMAPYALLGPFQFMMDTRQVSGGKLRKCR